jgi:hypothetical protein
VLEFVEQSALVLFQAIALINLRLPLENVLEVALLVDILALWILLFILRLVR